MSANSLYQAENGVEGEPEIPGPGVDGGRPATCDWGLPAGGTAKCGLESGDPLRCRLAELFDRIRVPQIALHKMLSAKLYEKMGENSKRSSPAVTARRGGNRPTAGRR